MVELVLPLRITRSNSSTSISLTVRSAAVVLKSRQPVFQRQASPSNGGPELNSPSREAGFFRAGTAHARSAFAFSSSSIVCNSQFTSSEFICGTPWFYVATDLPTFRLWFSCGPQDGTGTVCGAATPRYAVTTTRLERRRPSRDTFRRSTVIRAAAPATACQNTDARCHALPP